MKEDIITAARHVLYTWDNEDQYEKNDLSTELWEAMAELRRVLTVIHEVVP